MANKHTFTSLIAASVFLFGFPLAAPAPLFADTVDLPKTGQTLCYSQSGQVIDCAGTGQDGETQVGISWPEPRFTDNGDGTIKDNLTGLTWLRNSDCFGRVSWPDALVAANGVTHGDCGLSDGSAEGEWRLPNILELQSLANMGITDNLVWLSSFGFIEVSVFGRWSSTTNLDGINSHFTYQFRERFMAEATGTYSVWPVKGEAMGPAKIWKTGQTSCYEYGTSEIIDCVGTGQDGEHQAGAAWPEPRFTDNNNGTVTDNLTGLVWLQKADCYGVGTWLDALAEANNLSDGTCGLTDGSSAGDWRLSNTTEILSLTDFSQSQPAIISTHPFIFPPPIIIFPPPPEVLRWTSMSTANVPSWGYFANPEGSGIYSVGLGKASDAGAWPVRNSKLPEKLIYLDGFESN